MRLLEINLFIVLNVTG